MIPAGAKREESILVTSDVAIDFMNVEEARVLSTPQLIGYLEMTSRNLLLEYLEPGNDSVGTHVNVYHLAATPIGMQVKFHAAIVSVEDRRVNFQVEAWDEKEKVGEGTHQRAIVDIRRFGARIQAKARRP
jgi:predicted thioesterase